jgi:hypothetical protein
MADLLSRYGPSAAATDYNVLQLLYARLVEETSTDPMVRMRSPIVLEDGSNDCFALALATPSQGRRGGTAHAALGHRPPAPRA